MLANILVCNLTVIFIQIILPIQNLQRPRKYHKRIMVELRTFILRVKKDRTYPWLELCYTSSLNLLFTPRKYFLSLICSTISRKIIVIGLRLKSSSSINSSCLVIRKSVSNCKIKYLLALHCGQVLSVIQQCSTSA